LIQATRDLDGLGRAGALRFVVLSRGDGDDLARIETATRPACCSRAAKALWVRLGSVG
jgi:hypothetical protein